MSRLQIKSNARKSLKGHYGQIIIMFLVYVLVCFAMYFVGGLLDTLFKVSYTIQSVDSLNNPITLQIGPFMCIFGIASTVLFAFGITSYFLKTSRNEEVSYKELFSKTNLWFAFIAITFFVGLFVTLWSILFVIPGIIATFAYKMVYYIKLDNPDMSTFEVIKKSKELMRGHKLDFFILQLSFIGWIILGVFTLGILYIWLIPYMAVSECNFYNDLLA